MKASPLLRSWIELLKKAGASFQFQKELIDFKTQTDGMIEAIFSTGDKETFHAICFCMGGGSYEEKEKPLRWISMFKKKNFPFSDFTPSNVGYHVNWDPDFLKLAEGKALKGISLTTAKGFKRGELMVTRYGLEGPPVYYTGISGEAFLDLQVDLSPERLQQKLSTNLGEKLTPLQRVKKFLKLSPAAELLLEYHAPESGMKTIENTVQLIKKFPIQLLQSRPLDEAISSAGGISWDSLNDSMMSKEHPGVFFAGEMIDWDAPTGGLLLQACVSTGYVAGKGIAKYLKDS